MNIQPVILSGGSGTRLWPLSRASYPKQLLPLVHETSLLQDTVLRLNGLQSGADQKLNVLPPIVVCNEEHRFLIAEQLRQLDIVADRIILEPAGRNTAPALALAAEAVREHPQRLLLVMPADHVIRDIPAFHGAVRAAAPRVAADGAFVTFGIVADRPETGYGYIQKGEAGADGLFRLQGFVEKPDAATAQGYLDSGEYYWNSGIFLFSVNTWMQQLKCHQPAILAACRQAWDQGATDLDFYRVDKDAFLRCPSDSIDYAVAEKLGHGEVPALVVPLDAGWSDVGAWDALWSVQQQDASGNVLHGDTLVEDSRNCLVQAESRFVAAVGVEDLIIAETADAVLVSSKQASQQVKAVVDWLDRHGRQERLVHTRVYRPWGWYESIDYGERFQVKRIGVKPGRALSLQMHHHRAEHWIVVKGTARVTRGDDVFMISENESTYIPLGVTHRLENPGKVDLEIIEVQSGSYLGEDDIVRFEDKYGR